MLRQGVPKTEIAREIGIARSTLYNELKRGTVEQIDTELKISRRYFWDAGQRVYEEHRRNSRPSIKFVKAYEFVAYAQAQILTNKLLPDAVCGRAKLEGRFKETVCTKTLYNYIGQNLLKVRTINLPLRVKRREKRDIIRKNKRVYGMGIEERPEWINLRKEFGHWEIDTVIGRKGSEHVLLTLDERQIRRRRIVKRFPP